MKSDGPNSDGLTKQEEAVLEALRRGGTNSDAADELGLSIDTVKEAVLSAAAKLGGRSRDEAVAVWTRKQRRARRMRRLGVLAAGLAGLAVVATVVASFLGGSGDQSQASDADAEDVRILIPRILDPAPGFSVVELPSGEERTFASSGVVKDLYWSPSKDRVIAELEVPKGRFAFIEYETGATRIVDLEAGPSGAPHPVWSPDETAVFFSPADPHQLEDRHGDLMGPAYWATAESSVVARLEGAQFIDEGDAEILPANQCFGGWSADSTRFAVHVFYSLTRVVSDGGSRVTVLPKTNDCAPLQAEWYPDELNWYDVWHEDPYSDLENIEARAPEGYSAVENPAPRFSGRSIWNPFRVGPGWGAAFNGPDGGVLTLFSFWGATIEYAGTLDGSEPPIVIGGDHEPLEYTRSEVPGCPMLRLEWCEIAVHVATALVAGDVETVMRFAQPYVEDCRYSDPAAERSCVSQRTGLILPTFHFEDGEGNKRSVSPFEFSLLLQDVAASMAAAESGATDEYGQDGPRIIGFTCGPWEGVRIPLMGCNSPMLNISWIEGGERHVIGLGPMQPGVKGLVVRGEGSGYELALNGGQEQPGSTLTRRRAILWEPPNSPAE